MPQRQNPRHITVTFDPDTDAYCPTCEYNLRGASGSHCPECGDGLTLAMPTRQNRYGFFLIGFACTAYLAISMNTWLFFMILHLRGGRFSTLVSFEYACWFLAVPYLALLTCFRKRIVQSRLGFQLVWVLPPVLILTSLIGMSLYRVTTT